MFELFSMWMTPSAYVAGVIIGGYCAENPYDGRIHWNIIFQALLAGLLWPVSVPYAIWLNHKEG